MSRPVNEETRKAILAWIRKGHRSFTRQQVAGLRVAGSREALDDLEMRGYLVWDRTLKRFHATARALEDPEPGEGA